MDNQCIQHRVSYITLHLTHVVSMLRNFPLGSSRITWSQCYETSYLDASRYTHSSRLTWDQCYETSYLDAFAIALCCGKSEHRGVVGGEHQRNTAWHFYVLFGLHEDHIERRVMLFSSFSFFFPFVYRLKIRK